MLYLFHSSGLPPVKRSAASFAAIAHCSADSGFTEYSWLILWIFSNDEQLAFLFKIKP
ncbi:hypothetical protein D3C84_1231100 [compost metagenome]